MIEGISSNRQCLTRCNCHNIGPICVIQTVYHAKIGFVLNIIALPCYYINNDKKKQFVYLHVEGIPQEKKCKKNGDVIMGIPLIQAHRDHAGLCLNHDFNYFCSFLKHLFGGYHKKHK